MARGTSLAKMVTLLKAEIGNNSGTNVAGDSALKRKLELFQMWLATELEWPFLERRWDVTAPVNTQFLTFPAQTDNAAQVNDINMEREVKVEVKWNQVYQPVEYGIGIDEYNTLDFALQQQSDPIQRWRAATNPNEPKNPNTFEVWPVPITAQSLRFTGQRALLPLQADLDTADLDDVLMISGVAAEVLLNLKQADAQAKLTKFQNRLAFIRQSYPTRDVRRVLGGGGDSEFKREHRLAGMIIAVK